MDDVSINIERELSKKILKGRFEILEYYQKGRTKDLKLDPWEDPEIQIYHNIDRYGFISDEKREKEVNEDTKIQEPLRIKKWLKVCQRWNQYEATGKLRERVFKGMPLATRGMVWMMMLKVQETMVQHQGVYESMREMGEEWSLDLKQIDVDVNRTYRNHIMFRRRYDVKQQALFNLLAAYSVYNSEVGYCQGMSQVAALLLMFLNEEEAFWAFVNLMTGDKHKMHGFFIPKFPKLCRFQDHFNKTLKKILPKLKRHLDKNEMFPNLYTVKWFLQCFLDRLPFQLTLRFWDIYVGEGEKVLISMCVCLMKVHKASLLKMDMEEMMDFFTSHTSHSQPFSDDKIISLLRNTYDDLRRLKLATPPCSSEQAEEETPHREMGDYEKPSIDQLVSVYGDYEVVGDGVEKRPEIPADGGKEHLPSFANHRFSQMIDFESGSDGADAQAEDLEMSRLSDDRSSRTSLTNSDLPSPATSMASPAKITIHKRLWKAAVTPNSLEDDNSVFSSSSSLSSQALQTNSLMKTKKKEASKNPFEMLKALNDMLPPLTSPPQQPQPSLQPPTQQKPSQAATQSPSTHPLTTKQPPLNTTTLNHRKKNPPHGRWATTVCAITPPSPAVPSLNHNPHQPTTLFRDSIFSTPPRSLFLLHDSFNRNKPLRSEGDSEQAAEEDNLRIPICHIPPSPLPSAETLTFKSDSIRSRLSLHDWPASVTSRFKPLSSHLTNSINTNFNTLNLNARNLKQGTDHEANKGFLSNHNASQNSLTPITVLHLKTVSTLKVPLPNGADNQLIISPDTMSRSFSNTTSAFSLSSSPLNSSSPPIHQRALLSESPIPENSQATFANHQDKLPSTLQKPLIFSSLKSPSSNCISSTSSSVDNPSIQP